MENKTNEDRLRALLGDRLADKLLNDNTRAVCSYTKAIYELTFKTVNDRTDLINDELSQPGFNKCREEVLACLAQDITSKMACEVTTMSCVVHIGMHQSMADYISHAAIHFEIEMAREKTETVTKLVDSLKAIGSLKKDEVLAQAAKAHSSNN